MDPDTTRRFAEELDAARRAGRVSTDLLSARGMTALTDAYGVQRALTALRVARGQQIIGWKLGYTSAAMRAQMGIDEPNYGPLTDTMLLPTDASVPPVALQPRVEPEIALVLDRPAPVGADVTEVLACCRAAHACLEIVDSVWAGYRFTLLDNTADGSSAGWFALGPPVPMEGLDSLTVELTADGSAVGSATGAAAGGHPAAGVGWLARQLADDPRGLRCGDVVLTGGLTAAVPLPPGGTVSASFGGRAAVMVSRPR